MWGRHAEAREQLTAAAEVLRAEPDADTVRALDELAALEVFTGSADADRLTTEALILGQALDVGARRLCSLLITRGIYLVFADRQTEAVAYLRESARLATRAGDNFAVGTRAAQPVSRIHRPGISGRSRAHRRRAPAPRRQPGIPGVCDRQPG